MSSQELSQIAEEGGKSKNKEKGDMAEKLFKDFLNDNKIPFYYIDQNKETYSEELHTKRIHRPDYIVHTQKGVFHIDVKYRKKESFGPKGEEKLRFYLNQYEIDSLYNFQDELHSDVWVAFTNNEKTPDFFFVPISEIYEYTKKIFSDDVKEKYSEIKEKIEVCFICIPEVLLYDHLSFDEGFYKEPDLNFYEFEIQYHIEKAKEIRNPNAVRWANRL
jgi:Holliday junction resolvase